VKIHFHSFGQTVDQELIPAVQKFSLSDYNKSSLRFAWQLVSEKFSQFKVNLQITDCFLNEYFQNKTIARWRRLITTTRIPQFVLFSGKLVQLLFKPHWSYQILITKGKRNEFW